MIRSFKQIMFEDKKLISKWLAPGDKVKEKSKSGKMEVYVVYTKKDRMAVRDDIVKTIKNTGHTPKDNLVGSSSIPAIEVKLDKIIRIFIKPIGGGGMNETTINATITELVPALMFYYNWSPSISNDKLLQNLHKAAAEKFKKASNAFVNSKDLQAGVDFVNQFEDSSKLQDKLNNAKAIYRFIMKDLFGSGGKVSKVVWGYRAKPSGINPKHPGDIFVYSGNQIVGVSLKAGGMKTKEPQLNTFINPVLSFFGEQHRAPLYRELGEKVYQKIPGLGKDYNYIGKLNKDELNIIRAFEAENGAKYEALYDTLLKIVRAHVTAWFSDTEMFTRFIEYAILKKDISVPTIVVKAAKDKAWEIKDANELENAIAFPLRSAKVSPQKAKQDIVIDLNDRNGKKHTMLFSIRTNKPKGHNKVMQGFNLAVKYNGLK